MPSSPAVPSLARLAAAVGVAVVVAGCAGGGVPPAAAQDRVIESSAGPIAVEVVADGLVHPWGLEILPDGRMLVTERPGRLRLVAPDGTVSEPLTGVPAVFAQRQGGLLDVAVPPDFDEEGHVYLTFARPAEGGASTAAMRGRLVEGGLADTETIFVQQPVVSGGNHFGSRLAFPPDGTVFVTTGDRFKFDPAQDLGSHIGKMIRLNRDGSVPDDNPFVGREDALPEIWSYGHRNSQGAAIHPETGALWASEHGPRGGDEVNVPEAGRNYGWPEVSWGRHYSGETIPDPPTRPEFADAVYQWTPVIAASGMDFYTGDLFPDWQGDLLNGGLVAQAVVRLDLDGQEVLGEERLPIGARVRQVQTGPDGAIYVLTDADNGAILRLSPAK
jgi:glucose/arabinose dehydrogenase